jgi:osmotically-inducible protein OsmY
MAEERDRLEARLHDALTTDARVGEPELSVKVKRSRVVVEGTVHTEERRNAVTEVVREVVPGLEVDNRVRTTAHGEPSDEEELP